MNSDRPWLPVDPLVMALSEPPTVEASALALLSSM